MNWISVKEQMPFTYDFVIVLASYLPSLQPPTYSIGRYTGKKWQMLNEQGYGAGGDLFWPLEEDEITHWMPLPEPPKEEREKVFTSNKLVIYPEL